MNFNGKIFQLDQELPLTRILSPEFAGRPDERRS